MDEIDREELSVMEPVGKKRAQAMLDAGLSRTEVAARLGTTYNTIAGMIAHGTLKEKREKKKYAEYADRTPVSAPITKGELRRYRRKLKIGDTVWIENEGILEKYRVIEKYLYFCILENARGRRTSETYVNLVIWSRG